MPAFRRDQAIPVEVVVIRLGVIQGVVQAPALFAPEGHADDQVGDVGDIAQFQEIAGEREIPSNTP